MYVCISHSNAVALCTVTAAATTTNGGKSVGAHTLLLIWVESRAWTLSMRVLSVVLRLVSDCVNYQIRYIICQVSCEEQVKASSQ